MGEFGTLPPTRAVEPSRRSDIAYITVKYSDGDEETIAATGFKGVIAKYVNHDAGHKRNRQEWDCIEIALTGPRRPVRMAD